MDGGGLGALCNMGEELGWDCNGMMDRVHRDASKDGILTRSGLGSKELMESSYSRKRYYSWIVDCAILSFDSHYL